VEDVERAGVAGRRIKKFNEISRTSNVQILEINFSHMGLYRQAWSSAWKGTENAEK
jgi:hypothetical protein